jgi:hypothetical protein
MTRDAVLLTAEQLGEANDEAQRRIAQAGVAIDPVAFVERRLQALVLTVFADDEDRQALVELRYQELLRDALADAEREAARIVADAEAEARRRSLLIEPVPPEPRNRSERRHPPAVASPPSWPQHS